MPPRNRFHDLVDATGVASRILWLFLGSGVVVVFLRTRNFAWGESKKSDFKLTDLFQRIILGLHQISWVYTSKKFITRMLCYWNSKNFWRKPPPTNGLGIHHPRKVQPWKKPGESYEKTTETFNCSTSTSLKSLRFFCFPFPSTDTVLLYRKLLDAPKCLLPAEKPNFYDGRFFFSLFRADWLWHAPWRKHHAWHAWQDLYHLPVGSVRIAGDESQLSEW